MTTQTPISRKQMMIFLIYGVVAWFIAAMLLRFLGPFGIYQGGGRALTYLLIIPGTVPFVWLAGKLAQVQPGQLFTGYTFSSAMAMLCDGTALWVVPTLYGTGDAIHAGAGGTILWGVGVGIFLAYAMDRRAL